MYTRLMRTLALAALALVMALLGCASSATHNVTTATTTPATLTGTPSETPSGADPGGAPTPTATHGTGGGGSSGGGGGSAPTATPAPIQGTDFVVTATSANSVGNATDINAAASNNNPNAILIVTANANPGGKAPVFDPHPLGVYYKGTKWAIFHEDGASWITGASYNVRVLAPSSRAFTVQVSSANTTPDGIAINSPITDSNHFGGALLVTALWRSNGPVRPGIYDTHPLAVSLRGVLDKWFIYHPGGGAWTIGALYNVQALDPGPKVFGVHASSGGRPDIEIDNAASNGNGKALIFVTSYGYDGLGIDSHLVGVWYGTNKWAVFHPDTTSFYSAPLYFVSVS